MQLDQFKFPS